MFQSVTVCPSLHLCEQDRDSSVKYNFINFGTHHEMSHMKRELTLLIFKVKGQEYKV